MKKRLLIVSSLLLSGAIYAQIGSYPVTKGASWKYLDNGTSQDATDWNLPTGANAGWLSGNAPLGYGDPMATVISFGPDSANKYITSYFYKDIEVNTSTLTNVVEFGIRRDDGAIVYVNGVEVFRDNMPVEPTNHLTFSSTTVDGANEKRYFIFQVPKTAFTTGLNRIAVEMHNRDGSSSDIGFDMFIKNTNPALTVSCDEEHIGCFTSIAPTPQLDHLIIAPEFRYQLLFKEGSAYMTGGGNVPGNHDFTGYVPTAGSSTTGHLSVNQENTPGGVSMLNIHLDEETKLWVVDDSKAVDMYNTDLVTTSRNCSGGITPWGTVITTEEDTAAGDANGDGYQDLGWFVEINPTTASVMEYGNGKQEKLWALGRMNHENIVITADGSTAYYGEDGGTHCVYKFVADTPNNFTSGKVYVLKMDLALSNDEPSSSTATWVQVPNTTQADRNNLRTVAQTLGGTNFNGVEDCEISPIDGKIYFTSKGKNRIYSFRDNGITISEFETFAGDMSYTIAGPNGPVSEPWADGNDNLTFDDKGNLWVLQDGGLNYIWVIRPDHTQSNPKIELFASMPAGSEPTGLTFTPDFKYGFFSVQHPNGNNAPQQDATFTDINFNASATVVFALDKDLGAHTPAADFIADITTVDQGDTVTFTDLSTNNPTTWAWTFEGGTPATSTEESPIVTYETPGTYAVSLTTSNAAGTSPVTNKTNYIVVEEVILAPVADFSANFTTVDMGETVTFTDLSTNNPTSWLWIFEGGDPATSTDESPTVTYAASGTYNVSLITSNEGGASPIVEKNDYIVVQEVLGTEDMLKGMVSLYPNPTQGNVTVDINGEAGNDISVEVFDMLGRKVSETKGQSIGGNQKIEVNLSAASGEQVYVVRVHIGDKTGTYKLIRKK